jgi:hypothetical protein
MNNNKNGDTLMSGIEAVAESSVAKVLVRLIMPIMILVIGWFLSGTMARIEATQKDQGVALNQIKSDVRDVNTRLDGQVISQVQADASRLDKAEAATILLKDRVLMLETEAKRNR